MNKAKLFQLDERTCLFISEGGNRFLLAEDAFIPLEKKELIPLPLEREIKDLLLICYFTSLVELDAERRKIMQRISKMMEKNNSIRFATNQSKK